MTNDPIDELRTEVEKLRITFPSDAYQMFVAGLVSGSVDYESLRRENILDGYDDKKIDFFWLDPAQRRVIIAQGTEKVDWKDQTPPANKASDLNTALAWIFDANLAEIVRDDVRAAADQFRVALEAGDIAEIELYYFHNSSYSEQVQTELNAVEANLRAKLKAHGASAADVVHTVRQIDRTYAAELLEGRYSAIAIKDDVTISLEAPVQEVKGTGWSAAIGPVRAQVLVELLEKYGTMLYSPNIRDYLGARRSTHNINQGIQQTAAGDPGHFWVFNNGVTFVTRDTTLIPPNEIRCRGIGVTNGAQTIGSLHEAAQASSDLSKVQIQARFISTDDPSVIEKIIEFNNTQNPIFSWEQRVHDPVQGRLQHDFQQMGIAYVARRGQGTVGTGGIALAQLAPWLAAFHGDPGSAHRNSRDLFEDDTKYNELFDRTTNVRHLLSVYRLGEAIGALKDDLKAKVDAGIASTDEQREYGYFRYAAFRYALLDMAAELLVTLHGGDISARRRFVLKPNFEADRSKSIDYLKSVAEFALKASREHLAKSESASEQFRTQPGLESLRGVVRQAVTLMQSLAVDVTLPLVEGIEILGPPNAES